jgi:hypothetical protein
LMPNKNMVPECGHAGMASTGGNQVLRAPVFAA